MSAVLYEKKGRIAYMTFNRPEALNSINQDVRTLRLKYLEDFRDDSECWVMILTGAGEKAFSTGIDLKERAALNRKGESPNTVNLILNQATSGHIWKPVIGAINGYCIGGGLELALNCDFLIAAEHAKFGMFEVKRGFTPASAQVILPRRIPMGEALYLLMTGDTIDANEALRIGLVHKVVPMAELMPTATKIAEMICSNGPLAVQATKQAAIMGSDLSFQDACYFAQSLYDWILETEDAKEGPKAFAEKRQPVYKGK